MAFCVMEDTLSIYS